MKKSVDRRSFMKIAGSSLGIDVLYTALPMPVVGEAGERMHWLGQQNGEKMTPFSLVQLSDAHVGFNGSGRQHPGRAEELLAVLHGVSRTGWAEHRSAVCRSHVSSGTVAEFGGRAEVHRRTAEMGDRQWHFPLGDACLEGHFE
jgi:hypothetical protein